MPKKIVNASSTNINNKQIDIKYGGDKTKVDAATKAHEDAVKYHTNAQAELTKSTAKLSEKRADSDLPTSYTDHNVTDSIQRFNESSDAYIESKKDLKDKRDILEATTKSVSDIHSLPTTSEADKMGAIKNLGRATADYDKSLLEHDAYTGVYDAAKINLKNIRDDDGGRYGLTPENRTSINNLIDTTDTHHEIVTSTNDSEEDVKQKEKERLDAEEEHAKETKLTLVPPPSPPPTTPLASPPRSPRSPPPTTPLPTSMPTSPSTHVPGSTHVPSSSEPVDSGNLCVIIKGIEGVGGPESAPPPTGPPEPVEPVYTDEEKLYKKKEDDEKQEEDGKEEMKQQQMRDLSERSKLANDELTSNNVFGSDKFSATLNYPIGTPYILISIQIFEDGLYFIDYKSDKFALNYIYFFPFIFTSTKIGDVIYLNRNEATLTLTNPASANKFASLYTLLQHKYLSKYYNNKEIQVKKIDEIVKYKLNTYINEKTDINSEQIKQLFNIQIIKCLNNATEKLILYYIIRITVKGVEFQLFYNFKYGLFYVGTDKPGDDKYDADTRAIKVLTCGGATVATDAIIAANVAEYPGIFVEGVIKLDNTLDSIIPYYSVNILTTPSKNEFSINLLNLKIIRLTELGPVIDAKQAEIDAKKAEIERVRELNIPPRASPENKILYKKFKDADNDEEITKLLEDLTLNDIQKTLFKRYLTLPDVVANIVELKRLKAELNTLNEEHTVLLTEKTTIEQKNKEVTDNPKLIHNGCNQLTIKESGAKKMFIVAEPVVPPPIVGGKRKKQTKRKKQSKRKKQTKRKKQPKRKKGGDITNTGDIIDFVFNNINKNNNYHQYTTVTEEYASKLTENDILNAIKKDKKIMDLFCELQVTNYIISIVTGHIGVGVEYKFRNLFVDIKTNEIKEPRVAMNTFLQPYFIQICNYNNISYDVVGHTIIVKEDEFQQLQTYLEQTIAQLKQLLLPIQMAYINTKMEETHKLYSLASDCMNSFYIINSLDKHLNKFDSEHALSFARKRPLNSASAALDVSEKIVHTPMELSTDDSTTSIPETKRSLIPRTLFGDFAPISDIIYIYDGETMNRYQAITGLVPPVISEYKMSTTKNLNLSIYESISNNYTIKYSEYGRKRKKGWCIFDDNNVITYVILLNIIIEKKTTMKSKISLKSVVPHKRSEATLNLPNSELNKFLNLFFFNPKVVRSIDYSKVYDLYKEDTSGDDLSILQEIKDTPQAKVTHKILVNKLEDSNLYNTGCKISLTPNTKLNPKEVHDTHVMLSKVKYLKYGDAYKTVKSRLTANFDVNATLILAIDSSIALVNSANNDLRREENTQLINLLNQGDIVRRLVLRANPYVNPSERYTRYNTNCVEKTVDKYIAILCTNSNYIIQYRNDFLKNVIQILSDIYYNGKTINIPVRINNPAVLLASNNQISEANKFIIDKILSGDSSVVAVRPDFLLLRRGPTGDSEVIQNQKNVIFDNINIIIARIRSMTPATDTDKYYSILAMLVNNRLELRKAKLRGGGKELKKGDVRVLAEFIYKNTLEKRSDFKAATTEGGKNKTLNINRINRRNKSNKKTTNIKNKTKKSKNKTINFKRINRKNKTM